MNWREALLVWWYGSSGKLCFLRRTSRGSSRLRGGRRSIGGGSVRCCRCSLSANEDIKHVYSDPLKQPILTQLTYSTRPCYLVIHISGMNAML